MRVKKASVHFLISCCVVLSIKDNPYPFIIAQKVLINYLLGVFPSESPDIYVIIGGNKNEKSAGRSYQPIGDKERCRSRCLARLGKYEQKTLLKIIRGVSPNYLVFHVKPLHPMSFPCDRLFKFSLLMSIGSVNLAPRKCTEARYRRSLSAFM
jgi:hypothetical protein